MVFGQESMDAMWTSSRYMSPPAGGSDISDETSLFADSSSFMSKMLSSESVSPAAAAATASSAQSPHQLPPAESWRIAASCFASHSGYAFALFPIQEILTQMHRVGFFSPDSDFGIPRQKRQLAAVAAHLRKWLSPSPLYAVTTPHVFRQSMGDVRGTHFASMLLKMLHEYEKPLLSDNTNKTIIGGGINKNTNNSYQRVSHSPLTRTLINYGVALHPWRDFLRGLCVALCRNDVYVDLPPLTRAIIAQDPAIIGTLAPPLLATAEASSSSSAIGKNNRAYCHAGGGGGGGIGRDNEEDYRAIVLGRCMLAAAAEFGQPALTMHACEVLNQAHANTGGADAIVAGLAHEVTRDITLAVHTAYRREHDWKFRSVSGPSVYCNSLMAYCERVELDRKRQQ